MKIYRSEGRIYKKNVKKTATNKPVLLKTEAESPGIGPVKRQEADIPSLSQEMLVQACMCEKWLDNGFWGRVLSEHFFNLSSS